jgi:hypothetical protein
MKESGKHEEEEVVEVRALLNDSVVIQGIRNKLIWFDAVPRLIALEVKEVLWR